jgi:hypothetical protein
MAHLVLRRSLLARADWLSVVTLVIAYTALTIALVHEWGLIVRALERGNVDPDGPAATLPCPCGDEP